MAASFLQFCATCEKQIIPNNSFLYCSENCRRKDNNKQSIYPNLFPSVGENTTTPHYSADLKPLPDIIPQLSPTKPPSPWSFFRLASEADYFLPYDYNSSDNEAGTNTHKNSQIRPYSAAAQSLRQLQHYTTTRAQPYRALSANPSPTSPTFGTNSFYRPAHLRSIPNSSLTTPSLSSVSSHESSPPISFPHNHPSYGSSRPLPPRSQSAACSSSPRSIELVTPHFSGLAHANQKSRATDGGHRAEGNDLLYEKNWTLPSVGRQTGSLKKLFNFEGMQGRPAIVRVGSSGYPAKGYVSTTEYEMAITAVPKGEERIMPVVTYIGGRSSGGC